MKVGVTSQNFRTITGHAGKTRRFIIYEADNEGIKEVERLDLPKEMAMHNFQGTEHPLDRVDYLITESCGPGFINRMKSRGIAVITTAETDPETAVATLIKERLAR